MNKNETLATFCDEAINDIGTKPSLTRREVAKLIAKMMSKAYDAGVKEEQVKSTRIMCGWKD